MKRWKYRAVWSGNKRLVIFQNTILILSSIAIFVLIVEIFLRPFFNQILSVEPPLKTAGYSFVPGQILRDKHLEWNTQISINADGFRDTLLRANLKPGSGVVLGDSFTEGLGVDLSQSFVKQAQYLLSETSLYNAGQRGHNPTRYIGTYKHFFEPVVAIKFVIMAIYADDDIMEHKFDQAILAPEIKVPDRTLLSYGLRSLLSQHSVIYNVSNRALKSSPTLYGFVKRLGLASDPAALGGYAKGLPIYDPTRIAPGLRQTEELVIRFRDYLRAADRSFIAMLIPTKEQVDTQYWRAVLKSGGAMNDRARFFVIESIKAAMAKHSVNFLDLTGAFLEHYRNGGKPLYFVNDTHLNAEGHQLTGNLLARKLIELKLADRGIN